jgi:threonine synthase
VLLAGLARDGGLYVPETWPALPEEPLGGLPYAAAAAKVMAPFAGPVPLADLAADSYAGFGHKAVTPLVQIDSGLWLLELFHGPTLAFKDVALQLLGRLFDHVLQRRGERVTIVGATSGDTGSAAIEACRDRDRIDIFILHPHGRTSAVQRRQMTTVPSSNVHNIAVDGTFDDCQAMVKAMFADAAFRDGLRLSAVNSINWARIMAQIAYYAIAAAALGGRPLSFAVPTGNFGNVYAAYAARAMGLPIDRLIVGTNSNDILARFFATGTMSTAPVVPTITPSMDIQVSSNFERLLFDLLGRDGAAVEHGMAAFRTEGRFAVTPDQLAAAHRVFSGIRIDQDATRATMAAVYRDTGMLIDPHTAIGVAAAKARRGDPQIPVVALACAHPAKFPDAVEAATGRRPALPDALADLFEREERVTVLPNDLSRVKAFVAAHARHGDRA